MGFFSNLFSSGKKPGPKIHLQSDEMFHLLHGKLGPFLHPGADIRLADNGFILPDPQDVFKWIRASSAFYIPETGDCDDLAYIAKAEASKAGYLQPAPFAFGIVWTTVPNHAFNFAVTSERKVKFYDVGASKEVGLTGEITLLLI